MREKVIQGDTKNSQLACLGFKKAVKRKWIKLQMLKAIESRHTLKKKLLHIKSDRVLECCKLQYNGADQTVKRTARADK